MTVNKEKDPVMDIMMKSMFIVVMLAVVAPMVIPMLQKILPGASSASAQTPQAQSFIGLTDSKTLRATHLFQWINLINDPPYHPWVTAAFHNDGPQVALIGINNPDELAELAVGEDLAVDMTAGDRRIEFIYYKTASGIAAVRVIGKY